MLASSRGDFAIAVKRNTAMWRDYARLPETTWANAAGMPGAQVAALDYTPAGWPEHTDTIVHRVRVDAEDISAARYLLRASDDGGAGRQVRHDLPPLSLG